MANLRGNVSGSGYGSVYTDALVVGGKAWDPNSGPVKVWFGESGADNKQVEEAAALHGNTGEEAWVYNSTLEESYAINWTSAEKAMFNSILNRYSEVSGLRFALASSASDANIVWWKTEKATQLGVQETPQDEMLANNQIWGYFDPTYMSWKNSLAEGGEPYNVVSRAVGLAVGLGLPHTGGNGPDDGTFDVSDATIFPGVTGPYSPGTYGLNQGVYTVMSLNPGFNHGDSSTFSGEQAGPAAFDMAALQALYGVNTTTRTGNDIYYVPSAVALGTTEGLSYSTIWDAGGIDTISAARTGTRGVTIDLHAATLASGDPNAGGYISQARIDRGGFTIAKGVAIENATGGLGVDTLIGNELGNYLTGGGEGDQLIGNGGNDTLDAGPDSVTDNLIGGTGDDTYYITSSAFGSNAIAYELPNEGNDTVVFTGKMVLYNNIENYVSSSGTSGTNLTGNDSNNTITDGAGGNVISGGLGNDILTGGGGKDKFFFNTKANSKKTNLDHITDFNPRQDDIYLENSVFKAFGKKGTLKKPVKLSADAFALGTKAHDAEDRVIYNQKKGILSYDADGTGRQKAVQFAILDNKVKLTASDFFIV